MIIDNIYRQQFRLVVQYLEGSPVQEARLCLLFDLAEIAEGEIPEDECCKTWARRKLVFMYWIFCGTKNAWEWDPKRKWAECGKDQELRQFSDSGKPSPKSPGAQRIANL